MKKTTVCAIFIALIIFGVIGYYLSKEKFCGYCRKDIEAVRTTYAREFVPYQAPTAWTITNIDNGCSAELVDSVGKPIQNLTCFKSGGLLLAKQLLQSKVDENGLTCSYNTTNPNVYMTYTIPPYNDNCTSTESGAMKCIFWPPKACPNPTTLQASCKVL